MIWGCLEPLEYLGLQGNLELAVIRGSLGNRVRGARWGRQDSQVLRDPKVLLGGPGKMDFLGTREPQVD